LIIRKEKESKKAFLMNNSIVSFVPFKKEYKSHFVDLNLEWLEHYFWVEDHDKEVLNQCEETIIKQGGHIFFVLRDKEVVGTYAFMKIDDGMYEFTKMAVLPSQRGNGIGNLMMQHAIGFAKESKWHTIIIYSSTILTNAIHLYLKYGFVEIEVEAPKPYERGDIKMKLEL